MTNGYLIPVHGAYRCDLYFTCILFYSHVSILGRSCCSNQFSLCGSINKVFQVRGETNRLMAECCDVNHLSVALMPPQRDTGSH